MEYFKTVLLKFSLVFRRSFLSACGVLGTVLGTGDTAMNKTDKNSCLYRSFIKVGGNQTKKQVKQIACQVVLSTLDKNKVGKGDRLPGTGGGWGGR